MPQSMLSAPIVLIEIELELEQSTSAGRSPRADAKFIQVRNKATVQPHRVALRGQFQHADCALGCCVCS